MCDGGSPGAVMVHEVESWGATGGRVVWVKVPHVAPGTTTDFRMYWGHPCPCEPLDPSGVWSNGFVGVWHLVGGDDSTAFENHATNNGTTATPAGAFSPARVFEGSSYLRTEDADWV